MDGAVAAALVPLTLAVALPFRRAALSRTPLLSLGWDAALHATEGLDLFDHLRLAHPLDALALLASRHWWGPVWAVVSAPFQAAFGPSLAAASLPSLVAFALMPSTAFLLVRRMAPGGLLAAAAASLLVAGLFLRSPMLLETSAWPMLESLGGLLALASWFCFSRRSDRRERRAAFLGGAALFLLKYHYGFFVLGTFAAIVLLEETTESRRSLGESARAFLRHGVTAGILGLASLLAALRLILEARGGDAAARKVPSVPNVTWGACLLLVVLLVVRRKELAPAWNGASGTLRDLVLFGLLPPALWLLDPANARGWYRQIFQPTASPAWNPPAKLASFGGFLLDDYTLGVVPAGLVLAGLLLAIVLPGEPTRRAVGAFAVWPMLLMSQSTYPVEPRFVACLVPCLFAAAVAGLLAGASRLGERKLALALAAVAVLLFLGLDRERWRAEWRARAPYRYAYGAAETDAVNAALAAAPASGPVRLRLPVEPPVWPTVRLALRLGRRDLAPVEVDVSAEPP